MGSIVYARLRSVRLLKAASVYVYIRSDKGTASAQAPQKACGFCISAVTVRRFRLDGTE